MAYYKIRAKSDEESQLVQHMLFKKGYYWTNKGQPQNIHLANPPYIFVEPSGKLQWNGGMGWYSKCPYPEVSIDQIESTIPDKRKRKMETYFLNYSPLTGFSVKTYRDGSWFNDNLAGFVKDSSNNVSCCIELKNVKEGLISVNSHEWCCFPEDRDTIDEILAEIREAIKGH